MSRRFQFPTGWNSTDILELLRALTERRFNSQRDGILPMAFSFSANGKLFQFPTGWNSTSSSGLKENKAYVSIPNGMEFYCKACYFLGETLLFQFPTGWNSTQYLAQTFRLRTSFNSQRDGILLFIKCGINTANNVSIPNGMEFYEREAILYLLSSNLFQFPTGWNSTLLASHCSYSSFVSIPNGMEFYFNLQ